MALYTSRDAFLESGLAPVALTSDDDCLICFESLSKPDCNDQESKPSICDTESAEGGGHSAVKIEGCGHVYGSDCIRTWVETGNTCPLCRKVLFPKSNPFLRYIRPESYTSDPFRGTSLYDGARRREQDIRTMASPYSPLSRTLSATHRNQESFMSRSSYRRRKLTRLFSRRHRARYHSSDADSILPESDSNMESVRAEAGSVIDTGFNDDVRSVDINSFTFGDGTSDAEQTRDDVLSNVADAGDGESDEDSDEEESDDDIDSDDEDEHYIDVRNGISRFWRMFHRVN